MRDCGFVGLRVVPWLWELPPNDKHYYPLFVECIELGVPFFNQVGHAGPLKPSEPGRPNPYLDEVRVSYSTISRRTAATRCCSTRTTRSFDGGIACKSTASS